MNNQLGLLLFSILLALIILSGVCIAVVTLISAIRQYLYKRNSQQREARSANWAPVQTKTYVQTETFPMLYLIGTFLLIVALSCMALMITGIFYNSNFQSGKCKVISKSMKQEKVTITTGSHTEYNSTTEQYDTVNDTAEVPGFRAAFVLSVQNGDGSVYTSGRDVFHSARTDRGAEQALLDKYQVGETYDCWYYRFDPTQASFSQPDAPQGFLFFLIPVAFFSLIGTILTRIGRKSLSTQRPRVTFNRRVNTRD